METDSDGNVTGINHEAIIGNHTADTAPVVYLNEMGGWRSSSAKAADTSYLDAGMIYVSAGGRSRDAFDDYIQQVLNSDESALIEEQTNLLNVTEILLANNGHNAASFAHYWRDRSGTADQHTSFSIGYNILLAAQLRGATVDYHLVWDMGHGNNEGTSTGTMIDWINEICS